MRYDTAPLLKIATGSISANEYEQDESTDVIGDSLDMIAGLSSYNQWVYDLVKPYLGERVLEVGCGTGNITQHLVCDDKQVVGIEPVGRFVTNFAQRFEQISSQHKPQVLRGTLSDVPEPTCETQWFDSVVSFNVLEHIDNHVAALSEMKSQICPGGTVVVYAPGSPFAFGELDRALGHYRRYTPKTLKHAMEDAGLQWIEGKYSNMIGMFGWWFNSRILKKQDVPGDQAKVFDRIVPFVRLLERVIKPRFGQSVIGVGMRPMTDTALASKNETQTFLHAA